MQLSEKERSFLDKHHAAAMITLRNDGTPHAVRVGVALVDGNIWSSGVPGRVRTAHLRRDPRATLLVFEQGFGYLSVEARVKILDGADGAEQNLRLFEVMQAGRSDPRVLMWNGKPLAIDAFLQAMRVEQRLIYQFEPVRTYGLF
jgi:PPOX class probable F420-dependent enzyme